MKYIVAGTAAAIALSAGAAIAAPHFIGGVVARWDPDGRHMWIEQPLTYIDASGETWDVPAGTEVDGASIPKAFWSMIGGPFEGKYRGASVIHDYFCDVRTRPWRQVDRMFYEAMIASGVPDLQAKTMYYAVVAWGPRWDEQAINNTKLSIGGERPTRGGGESGSEEGHAALNTPANYDPTQVIAQVRNAATLDDIDRAADAEREKSHPR